jgi:endoglucanase
MASWILENKVPNTALINKQQNRGLDLKNYLTLLQSIVKVLQYRRIGVLLSMHTLTYSDNGKLWYNADVSEAKFLNAIDILNTTLCSKEYWNVMGIDLKNEPSQGTWGDDSATDFRAGAKRIADRMLKGCPNWMGFVEGVNAKRTMKLDGAAISYYDWYGGGLQGAKNKGLEFSLENKVVWAPHYYTPAVYPQEYFFGGGTLGTGLQGYVELSDTALRSRIKQTMDDMFGFLASETGPALMLGEFGGLYAEDTHPKKTTKRCTDFTIEIIKQPGWAGGFVWSLNPESEYQYNPADTPGRFYEGLVGKDWLSANDDFMKGMAAMDDMDNLQPFPCFPTKAASK